MKTYLFKYTSSYHIKGTYCQNDLVPLMLTLITWLRWVCQVSRLQLLSFSPFPSCTHWKEVTMCSSQWRGGELTPHLPEDGVSA